MLGSLTALVQTILPQIIWVLFIFAFIILLLAVLPTGAQYPLPTEFGTAIHTLVQWALALNHLIPVDTMLQMFFYITIFNFVVKPLWFLG